MSISLRLVSATVVAAFLSIGAASAGAQQHDHREKAAEKKMGNPGHDMAGHGATAWKEMDTFHKVLGATYHPAADARNLAPLKAASADLAAKATAWEASVAPSACAGSEVKANVASVAKGARDLAGLVQGGAGDDQLVAAITAVHDTFEKVEKACGGHAGMKH